LGKRNKSDPGWSVVGVATFQFEVFDFRFHLDKITRTQVKIGKVINREVVKVPKNKEGCQSDNLPLILQTCAE